VRAVDQLAVDDAVEAQVFGEIRGTSAVPAAAMAFLCIHSLDDKGKRCQSTIDREAAMSMCGGPTGPREEQVGNTSGRKVLCVKFQKELPGLDAPPWPGELGQRVYESVSTEAWKLWEERQKMILNEYRVMPWQKEGQEVIRKHMEDFFFGEGSALPPDYVPQQSK
jgi:Fe-S cluster biosynthesis and repair protein YggX